MSQYRRVKSHSVRKSKRTRCAPRLRCERLEERTLLAAVPFAWTGAASTENWNDPDNWDVLLTFPGDPSRTGSAGDTTTFNSAATVQLESPVATIDNNSLTVNNGFVDVDLNNKQLNLASQLAVNGTANGNGNLALANVKSSNDGEGPVSWVTTPLVTVGVAPDYQAGNPVTLSVSGDHTYLSSETIQIGGKRSGFLDIKEGGRVYAGTVDVGGDHPDPNTRVSAITVSGGPSTAFLDIRDELRLGTAGTGGAGGRGVLTIQADGLVTGDKITVGHLKEGAIVVNGGQINVSQIDVGIGATGQLDVTPGQVFVGILNVHPALGHVRVYAGGEVVASSVADNGGNIRLFGGSFRTLALNNSGTLEMYAGSNVQVDAAFANAGTATWVGATDVNLSAGLQNSGGIVEGYGAMNLGAALVNAGVVTPGLIDEGLEINFIELYGDYEQTPIGILEIQLASTSAYDVLAVNGSAGLAGHLDVSLFDGFTPQLGDQFQIVTGSVSGAFEDIPSGIQNPLTSPLPALSENLRWHVSYDGGVTLTVVEKPTISISDIAIDEAVGVAIFTVTLSAASSGSVTVDYQSSDGTAIAGSDYTAVSGTLSFAPGETEQTIEVSIASDDLDEFDETFTIHLSNAVDANIDVDQALGTI
jgi:fibronectin-binding autotransporter adhesin